LQCIARQACEWVAEDTGGTQLHQPNLFSDIRIMCKTVTTTNRKQLIFTIMVIKSEVAVEQVR